MSGITNTDGRVRVLAVSPYEQDHHALRHIFGHTAWSLESADTYSEACDRLMRNPAPVVLCEQRLQDGDWKDLLAMTQGMKDPSHLVVISKHADDRLWAEVLNLGAYDVLAKPLVSPEVFRIVGLAWRNWMDKRRVQSASAARRETPIYFPSLAAGR
jgi:DNA-binding NtrC family response regulator